MDQLQTRLDALEQQMHAMNRRLLWWRGLACGLAVLGMLGWGLPLSLAREDDRDKDKDPKGLVQRVAALEQLLKHVSRDGNEIFITGANLHIVNGLGQTDCGPPDNPILDCPNGVGNLIVGYNEPRVGEQEENIRTASHNVVVERGHNFSRFGGLIVGAFNTISGDFAVVSGGILNVASGGAASVSGGGRNDATGDTASVSRGDRNLASGERSWIGGGSSTAPRISWRRSVEGSETRAAGSPLRSAAGRVLPKRLPAAGRRDRKALRFLWATSAPRSLPREARPTGAPAPFSKTSRGLRREPTPFPTG
jgi:hypothetical protein